MPYRFLISAVIALGVCFGALTIASAQYGNEWIDFNKTHFKIPVTETGIYRITYSAMQNAGIDVGAIDHKKYQLYHRGIEQAVNIDLGGDNTFNQGDFIEFYGVKNDGTLDSELYEPKSEQPHAYLNLFSDTTAYFLTWSVNADEGKRMEAFYQANNNNLPAEPYHTDEKLSVFNKNYSAGRIYNNFSYLSSYDFGEGFTDVRFAAQKDYQLSGIADINNNGPKPHVDILLAGRNGLLKIVQLKIGGNNKGAPVNITGYDNALLATDIEFSDISQGNVTLALSTNTNASVSYIRLRYPQNFKMNNASSKYFNLVENNQNTSYIEILNPPANTVIYDVTLENTVKIIDYDTEPGKIKAIIPETSDKRTVYTVDKAEFLAAELNPVSFRNLNIADRNYLIISHASLMKPVGDFNDAVRAYGEYRSSPAGGSFDTLVVDIQQLYDQFTFGEETPLAIRRFSSYMLDKAVPEFLLIVGKGLSIDWRVKENIYAAENLVPTYGWPGSDLKFTSGLAGTIFEPAIPTGRITASTPKQVIDYLDKVILHEASGYDDSQWRKNLLHLSGGLNQAELNAFRNFLDGYKTIAEGPFLGGNITTVQKGNTEATEKINIADVVNDGVSMITFFGHSAGDVIEIDIGKASNPIEGYANKGRYPLIFPNGCNVGNSYASGVSLGEDWLLTPDKGAILFLGHSHLGFADRLNNYTTRFYKFTFSDPDLYGSAVGKIHQQTIKNYMEIPGYAGSPISIAGAQQTNMQGDPAVVIFDAPYPDYATDDDRVWVEPYNNIPVTAIADTFNLRIAAANLGKAVEEAVPFRIRVKRTYPNGDELNYGPLQLPQVNYLDTLAVKIYDNGNKAYGLNKFEVFLDDGNSIQELNEDNNYAVLNYFLPLSGLQALFPPEYSISDTTSVSLAAQPTNTNIGLKDYFFELDTTNLFNSFIKKDTTILDSDILPTWSTNLPIDEDSTVYYWRIRFKDYEPEEDTLYGESSFIYIKNSPTGWSQSHFPQFSKAELTDVLRDNVKRKWDFEDIASNIKVRTFGGLNLDNGTDSVFIKIDDVPEASLGQCAKQVANPNLPENAVYAIGFDHLTLLPYKIIGHAPPPPPFPAQFWNWSCGKNYTVNTFDDNKIINNGWLDELIDAAKPNDYVLLVSAGALKFNSWTAQTKEKLKEIGASQANIDLLTDDKPYIILGRKGANPGDALAEIVGLNDIDKIELDFNIEFKPQTGIISSSIVGPAMLWDSVFHQFEKTEDEQTYKLDLYGVDLQEQETLLIENIVQSPISIDNFDAAVYPYMRLKAEVEDPTLIPKREPPQLKKWRILYEGVPEGLALAQSDEPIPDKQEGEEFTIPVSFRNISGLDFPEKIIVQTTVSNNQQATTVRLDTLGTLPAGGTLNFSAPVNTLEKTGDNKIQIYFNPEKQPETYYANNIIEKTVKVIGDSINPILDVVFDGRHILDGDIVSASPLIGISLDDENKYLIQEDTVGLDVFLKKPCDACEFEQIYFDLPEVTWTPAGPDNNFKVEYHPKNLPDGIYTLRVQGTDESENESGSLNYEIRFQVIGEATITNFYPFPNPFSSRTRFIFTLTGSEVPDQIKIQIMTVTGKVVREITQDEIGAIVVGNNITNFAWDGTDEFGDKLANGVYLYRVITRSNGESIKHRETSADKAFKKQFGKIVILR